MLKTFVCNNLEYRVVIKRSRRKSISMEIKNDRQIVLRAPDHLPSMAIAEFMEKHNAWIVDNIKKIEASNRQLAQDNKANNTFTVRELQELADRAKLCLPPRIREYAKILNVSYKNITIRAQKTRWGSCSSKGNINLNCLLMLTPEEIQDYVIVHELCHLKEMNHSKAFWAQVESVLPDYSIRRKWLKDNGSTLIGRLPG